MLVELQKVELTTDPSQMQFYCAKLKIFPMQRQMFPNNGVNASCPLNQCNDISMETEIFGELKITFLIMFFS